MSKNKQGTDVLLEYALIMRPGRNDLSFFRLPKDNKIRKDWVIKCKRNDKLNANTSRICSDHFENKKKLCSGFKR